MWSVVQHVAWEGPGIIGEVMRERGCAYRVHRMDEGDALPTWTECDGLVVMGGPMGVYEAGQYPFLRQEIGLLGAMVFQGRPVLGVCLGAQLLAAALGAEVVRGPVMEAGAGTVRLTQAGTADAVMGGHGDELPVVHWHQDTYPLPHGAVLLASSEQYEQQAFRFGTRVYGWQFHPEVNAGMARDWRDHGLELSAEVVGHVERAGRAMVERFFSQALS